jgi:ATP-dependent Clp protease ATP-binding subunit ClpC
MLDKSIIISCDKCPEDGKCPSCLDHKNYIILGNYLIYWSRDYNEMIVFTEQSRKIVKVVINLILVIIGVLGLISLFYHIYLLKIANGDLSLLDNWQGIYLLVFWVSLIFTMFLFYKVKRNRFDIEKVVNSSSFDNKKEKLTEKNIYNVLSRDVKKLLIGAWFLSKKSKSKFITPLHLFLALLKYESVKLIFGRLGINQDSFKQKIERLIEERGDSREKVLSDFETTMFSAYLLAHKTMSAHIEISHVLTALGLSNEDVVELFLDSGVGVDQVSNVITWVKLKDDLRNRYKRYKARSIFKPKGAMNRSMTAIATPFLDRFSQDMTYLAKMGYLELNVARDNKIEEIYRIIETGNNGVILVGQPGVGKDSVIEGLANRMAAEEVPKHLQDKRLISLSLSSLVSKSSVEGQVENNLLRVMNEVARSGNIILIIQDIHNIVGVTSAGTENIDLSEVLADVIAKYNVMIISTTTPSDYTKYLERNPLSTNLLKVDLPEPNFNETVQILEAKTFSIEGKYNIYFSYQSIERIVKLTSNYIHDRFQPSKSIKILEEVAVMVRKAKGKNHLVTAEDVSKIISEKVNIPLGDVSASESDKLMNLEELIHKRIIGQHEAVKMVSSALRRARAELRDESKPITNLLFLGPTGVGKTELAKTVSQIFFNSEEDMIRLDMSEYQEKTSLARLIGIEGSTDGGVLTESIRKNPFSLLLLDEIEKAHPDILNIFLQVMDDGRLTDSSGRTVDFSNCIIIATSNAAAFYIQDQVALGTALEKIKQDLLQNELRSNFRPEFLNRFNGIVLFKPLEPKEIEQIAVLMLRKVTKRLDKKGIHFSASDTAIKELAEIGFSKEFGARPLARAIQQRVDDSLANFLLTGKIGRRDRVVLEKGGEIRIEKAKKF